MLIILWNLIIEDRTIKIEHGFKTEHGTCIVKNNQGILRLYIHELYINNTLYSAYVQAVLTFHSYSPNLSVQSAPLLFKL